MRIYFLRVLPLRTEITKLHFHPCMVY